MLDLLLESSHLTVWVIVFLSFRAEAAQEAKRLQRPESRNLLVSTILQDRIARFLDSLQALRAFRSLEMTL
jgi:hypothetical protein